MSATAPATFRQILARVYYFFPFQLVLLHLKRSHLLLLFWALLFSIVTHNFAERYGIPYLFLEPEYLNEVGFWSYFIMGLGCGIFIMTFNIASYTANGSRFHFIATIRRPFLKYSENNSFFPLLFLIIYLYNIFTFHVDNGNIREPLLHASGLIFGTMLFLVFTYIYFFSTNKNIFSLFGITKEAHEKKQTPKDIVLPKRRWWAIQAPLGIAKEWRVDTYMSSPIRIRLARGSEHYPKELLMRVFNQNHTNATRFQIAIFSLLIVFGLFREIRYFQIPAGASILLILSMFLIITSVLQTWLRGWAAIVIIALIVVLNESSKHNMFSYDSRAYGLNYAVRAAKYDEETLAVLNNDTGNFKSDVAHTVEILNKWRLNNTMDAIKKKKKPKLVIINCSGGGSRSALWSFHSIAFADSVLKGGLLKHTQMITGASGGMLGAAYLRELYFRSKLDSSLNIYDDVYLNNISKDLLNQISFSIVVNDLFVSFQEFNDGKYTYTKDRAYSFERHFNENTGWVLDKRMSDYIEPEMQGTVPMMILYPVITNDARRLLIASQPVSYLVKNSPLDNVTNNALPECVEFARLFADQDAMNLHFMSALRMSATFPLIFPNSVLPSMPEIAVMDAGLRDNFGTLTTLRYLYTFRNWLSTNTSGVVIVEVRDKFKADNVGGKEVLASKSKLQSLFLPIGTLYGNITTIQTYSEDDLLMYASLWFDGKIDVVPFQMKNESDNHVSLSWHLTGKEKKQIIASIDLPENQESIKRLEELLK